MTGFSRIAALLALIFMSAGITSAATPEDCHALRKHGHRSEAQACYQSLTLAHDAYTRAEGYWGLAQYSDANNEFRAAVAQADRNAMYRVRWGRLLHDHSVCLPYVRVVNLVCV